jgi:uncharacterized membrane protein
MKPAHFPHLADIKFLIGALLAVGVLVAFVLTLHAF